MSARFRQVFSGRWPSGGDRPIAILRAGLDEMERRFGLTFSLGRDDLDEFREAALVLASGRPVQLMRYRHSPGTGTTISVDRNDSADEARRELLETFGRDGEAFSWVSD